ncbi:MAG TPA: hypothetical protein VHY91_16445 [Pirellulales bacterium]|jgi:hypothetical protein|nr:hypothetical protein [Pirellulales bacterium]
MGFGETLIFYLVVGCVVAVAVYVTGGHGSRGGTAFRSLTAIVFWPLYLPLLLSARQAGPPVDPPGPQPDSMAAAIADVERELDTALANLDGWAESALAREKGRIAELRGALSAQARRIREMDVLLSGVAGTFNAVVEQGGATDSLPGTDHAADNLEVDRAALGRCRRSEQARAQNLARLAAVRRQTHADLMATLAWIRELVSMMHLAKFTGAPASRTEELMAQIAAAVEGVSDAGWRSADADGWATMAAAETLNPLVEA